MTSGPRPRGATTPTMRLLERLPLSRLVLMATVATALTACGSGSEDDARLRLLNASPDLGTVDLTSDKDKLSSNVATLSLGEYGGRKAGVATLQVRGVSGGATLASSPATLKKDTRYTLIAYGGAGRAQTTLLQEDQTEPASGQSKLMVMNLAPDAGKLRVFVTAADTVLNDAQAFGGREIDGGQSTGYVTQTAGRYRIRVTDADRREDLRLDLPAVELASGKVATLVLRGSGTGMLVHGLMLEQRGALTRLDNTMARVRLVTSFASGGVEATLGGQSLMSFGTPSPTIGEYRLVRAGAQDLNGLAGGFPFSRSFSTFAPGGDYTVLMRGEVSAPTISLMSDDNRLPATAGQARLRLLNGLSQPLTLNLNYSQVASSVAPGSYGSGTFTPSSSSLLTVSGPGSPTPLYKDDSFASQANGLYTVLMLGSDAQPQGILRKDR